MAIEESSVVAAASKAAKFWGERGGFKTTIINTEKIGQVHFLFHGNTEKLNVFLIKLNRLFLMKLKKLPKTCKSVVAEF